MGQNLTGQTIASTYEDLVQISGSLRDILTDGTGSEITSLAITASNAISSSYALTASFASNVPATASFAISASHADNANFSISSSYALSASFATNAVSSSYAVTASYSETTAPITTIFESVQAGENLVKTDPVYLSGSSGANPIAFKADAADPAKMPAIYIMNENLSTGQVGQAIALGLIEGVNLSGYDAGDEVFVAAGGGWTDIRPTGTSIVQALGVVTKGGAGGKGFVYNAGEFNLPNIAEGFAWVGNSSSYPVAVTTSSFTVDNAVSASYALSASHADSSNTTISASHAVNADSAISASYANNSDTAVSASYALTASFAENAAPTFPFTGSAIISGSLIITGSSTIQSNSGTALQINGKAGITNLLRLSRTNDDANNFVVTATDATNATLSMGNSAGFGAINFNGSGNNNITANSKFLINTPNLTITGSSIISGSLIVTGSTTLQSGLTVTGSITITGSAAITDSLVITGSLSSGTNNIASGPNSAAIGGEGNNVSGNRNVSIATENANLTGTNAFIIGGGSNSNNSTYGGILGSLNSTMGGSGAQSSNILGGENHSLNGIYNGIIGGFNNTISSTYSGSVILGGNSLSVTKNEEVVVPRLTISGSFVDTMVIANYASIDFVDDAAAAAGGIPLGGVYRNGNFLMIRIV